MPGAPIQAVKDSLATAFSAQGIPLDLLTGFWAAIDAGGYTVVEKTSGAPVETLDHTPMERVHVDGAQGMYLCGVRAGERGWFTWLERQDSSGNAERTEPVFSPGAGAFLLKPKTTGMFTVGESEVEGTDEIS